MKRDTRRRLCRVNDGRNQLTDTEGTRIKLFSQFGFPVFCPPWFPTGTSVAFSPAFDAPPRGKRIGQRSRRTRMRRFPLGSVFCFVLLLTISTLSGVARAQPAGALDPLLLHRASLF